MRNKTKIPLVIVFLMATVLLFCGGGRVFADGSGPRAAASPEYLVFYAISGSTTVQTQTFAVSNSGTTGPLNYTLAKTASWLNISPASGSVTTTPSSIMVTVNPSGLTTSGSPYIGDITVSDTGNAQDLKKVRVRLTVLTEDAYVHGYEYDSKGNVVRRVTPNGDVIEYSYDPSGRLNHVYYPDSKEVVYTYDAAGNRTGMTDWHGTTTFTYDELNRLRAVTYPGINPVLYDYDKAGKLIKITYPDQKAVSYVYDNDGRLKTATDPSGATSFEYDNTTNHLNKKTLPNGVYTTYTYDLAKRATDVVNKKSDNSLVSSYHYVYDVNNNITQETETTTTSAITKTYTYDKLNRLTRADYSDGTYEAYTYDSMGNRLTMTTASGTTNYDYDSDNRLIKSGDTSFFYDKNGNLIKKVSSIKTETYQYDYNNMLVQYANGTDIVTYEYDGDRNRIAKVANAVRTNYVNDINRSVNQVLMEADSNWSVKKKYVYGLDLISQETF